jgi:hypothetical protein
MGALIFNRTNGNRIGYLMILLGFALADPFRTSLEVAQVYQGGELTTWKYFAFWTQGWLFFVVLFSIFLILLNFPDGQPPSPRWNWVQYSSLIGLVQFVLIYTFQPSWGDADFQIANPIALTSVKAEDTLSGLFFGFSMIFLGISSLISIWVRYRRAGPGMRAQIRWLLFAGVVSFVGIGYRLATYDPGVNDWTGYLLSISLLAITGSIAVAILRYRLYDIDFIIRRTLQYTILTATLAAVYWGGVILLQGIVGGLSGDTESPLITVLTTLALAALFNPLRLRIQDFIDKRFYRIKFDAEQALKAFSLAARDEVDLQALSSHLIQVVVDTVQPEYAQVIIISTRSRKHNQL